MEKNKENQRKIFIAMDAELIDKLLDLSELRDWTSATDADVMAMVEEIRSLVLPSASDTYDAVMRAYDITRDFDLTENDRRGVLSVLSRADDACQVHCLTPAMIVATEVEISSGRSTRYVFECNLTRALISDLQDDGVAVTTTGSFSGFDAMRIVTTVCRMMREGRVSEQIMCDDVGQRLVRLLSAGALTTTVLGPDTRGPVFEDGVTVVLVHHTIYT